MRLDKYLALYGAGSRSQVKRLIRKGYVYVDGEKALSPDIKIDENKQKVTVDGKDILPVIDHYYMLYKPAGVISATNDPHHTTVMDLLKGIDTKGFFPVGRLDIDTEGLMLITDQGEMAHRLLSPSKHVDKTYLATVTGIIDKDDIDAFALGIDIGEKKPTLSAALRVCEGSFSPEIEEADIDVPVSYVEITIHEGKFHQIKRMFEAREKKVIYLRRIQMGTLKLDPALSPGEYRPLTDDEIRELTGIIAEGKYF